MGKIAIFVYDFSNDFAITLKHIQCESLGVSSMNFGVMGKGYYLSDFLFIDYIFYVFLG